MDPDSFYSDDSSDGGGNFAAILDTVSTLGQTAIIASQNSSATVPYPGPAGSYGAGGYYGAPRPSAGPSLMTIVVLGALGFFAFTKLR